jgi:hypothetical protein
LILCRPGTFHQYLRQFLAKHSATLYLAVKSVVKSPDVGGEIAIPDFGEGIAVESLKSFKCPT